MHDVKPHACYSISNTACVHQDDQLPQMAYMFSLFSLGQESWQDADHVQ
jgi:hypothetical protein